MDDDVFNGLSYGDDNEWGTSEVVVGEHEQPGRTDITVDEINHYAVSASTTQLRNPVDALNDPLNWFNNISTVSLQAAKRRKLESQAAAVAVATQKIEDAKLRRKSAVNRDVEAMEVEQEKPETLLKFPPMTGVSWMGISDPENINRRYMTLETVTKCKPRKKIQLTRSKLRDTIQKLVIETMLPSLTPSTEHSNNATTSGANDKRLWIDKYAPMSFFELISENYINRLTLSWLNLWNEYIFNKPSVYDSLLPNEQKLLEIEDVKPFLPKRKVLILHGPPGCGKTMLATMAAKIKFSPFFINMNEISNVSDLNRALLHASSYHSISFSSQTPRPRCIIVDGLEYASTDIANALVRWIQKRKKTDAIRPIICTCNNLYSQTMREFRAIALPIKVTIDDSRFYERASDILANENKVLGNLALKNCIVSCKSDVRLCLNSLQFRCSSRGAQTNVATGKKADANIFDVIELILSLNKHSDRRGLIHSLRERFEDVSTILSYRPDMDRFVQILFENLPECIKLTTVQMVRVAELFAESDIHSAYAFANQNYGLLKYQTFSIVAVHFTVARMFSKRIKITLNVTNVGESRRQIMTLLGPIRVKGINMPNIPRLISDFLPMLMYIIQPPMQITGSLMYKNDGLESIHHIVDLMATFGLSLTMQVETGTMDYKFDPPVDTFTIFHLHSRHHQLSLPAAAKQFIIRQLEMRAMGHVPSAAAKPTNTTSDSNNPFNAIKNYQPTKTEPFCFRYSAVSAQAIKRNIKTSAFFK